MSDLTKNASDLTTTPKSGLTTPFSKKYVEGIDLPRNQQTRMEIVEFRRNGWSVEEITAHYRSKGFHVRERHIKSRLNSALKLAFDMEFVNALRVHETEKLYEMDKALEKASLNAEQDLFISDQTKASQTRVSIHQNLSKLWGLHQNNEGNNTQVNVKGTHIEVSFKDVVPPPNAKTINVEPDED